MAYTKTNWVDGSTPINAVNLNHIEGGIEAALRDTLTCYLYSNNNLAIPNSATTLITLNCISEDNDGMSEVNDNGITIKTPGLYVISACISYQASGTGIRSTIICKGDTIIAEGDMPTSPSYTCMNVLTTTTRLAVGDVIYLKGWQNNGGAISALIGACGIWMRATRIGA